MPSFVTMGAAALRAPLFLAVFLAASLGIGRRLLLWLGVREAGSVAERVVVAAMLGAGTLQFIPFALGETGSLGTRSLRVGLALAALCALPDFWANARAIGAAARRAPRPPSWLLGWLAALLPGLIVALLLALTPTLDADGLGYHLTVPKRWLLSGAMGYLPTYPYSNTPMGVEMLFMSGLAVAGDTAAKSLHLLLGLLGVWAAYLGGKRLAGPMVGALAATALLYGPFGVGALLGWAYLEGATSAALLAATLAWLIWFQERDRAWLRCAVLLAGFGASFKITAGLFPVALGLLTVLLMAREARGQGRSAFSEATSVLRLVPLLVAPVLPWLARAALVTGNPVFPIAAQWIPSRDFPADMAAKFERYNRYMVWGSNLGPSWTLERRKLLFLAVVLLVMVVGAAIVSRQRSHALKATASVMLGTLLLQLAAVGLYKRYWIPVFAVFQLPVIALFAKELGARWARGALLGLTALGSLLCARQSLASVDKDVVGLVKTAVGAEPQHVFLLAHMPLFPIYDEANLEQPPPTGIGLSQYCGGFYLDQPTYCADIAQESLRYETWSAFVSDLHRLHISHFIAPVAWAEPGSKPTIDGGNAAMLVRVGEHACVSRLLRENARLVATAGDQGFYVIDFTSVH